jgi:hypothetical protein
MAKAPGNGLGVALVGCLAEVEALVVFVGQGHRAYLGAITAGGAFGRVDKTGAFINGDAEIASVPWISLTSAHVIRLIFRCRPNSTSFGEIIHMAQSWWEMSCPVRSSPRQWPVIFNHMDKVSRIGQIQRSLHSGDAAANNQNRTKLCPLSLFRSPDRV